MPDRPNVFVFLTDQQRWDTVGAYGNPMGLTPNLDALAERGTFFEQAFTPQPVCTPARACLQTGQYGTETGVSENAIPLPADTPRVAECMNEAGYRTGYVGKWHLGRDDPVPEGEHGGYEDYWRVANVLEHRSHPYEGLVYDEAGEPVRFDGYRVDALTEMAMEFVRESAASEEPFFCILSQLEPHQQNDMEAYVAPDGYAWRFRNPWVPGDLEGSDGRWQHRLADYYGVCRRIDECFGRLLDELERLGIREETIVVFTSDHGCHFGSRNAAKKQSPHESSIRIPLLVDGPGFADGTVTDVVSLIDLPPTLLDAAGVDVPDAMQGRSLMPLVDGATDPNADVLVQLNTRERGRVLRTDRWKYGIVSPDSGEYVEQYFFDLRTDPHEKRNLAGRGKHRAVADSLRERLLDRIEQTEGYRPQIADR